MKTETDNTTKPTERANSHLHIRVKESDLQRWKDSAAADDTALSKWVVSALNEREELKKALNDAAYALFVVKRMVGITDDIRDHVSAAHEAACKVIDNE